MGPENDGGYLVPDDLAGIRNVFCGSVKSAGIEIPRIAEFTLLRRDRLRSTAYRTTFPHPLDRPNVAKEPLHLAPCWYS